MKYMYLPTSTAHLAPSLKDAASSMQVTLSQLDSNPEPLSS